MPRASSVSIPRDSGDIIIDGKRAEIRSPRDAVQAGIALVTEDRQISGLALRLPIADNVTLANVERISRFGFLDLQAREPRIGGAGNKDAAQGRVARAASPGR